MKVTGAICLCKLCENTKYIANALKKSNIIETDELEKIIDGLTCDQDTYLLKRRCMFGTCEVCKNSRISYDTSKGNDEVEFSQWTSKIEKRLVKEEEKNITLTVKETMEMSASDLVNKFEDELVSWSWKRIPDAVGGALKRHADTEVKFGKDITNADIFLDCMSNSESVGYLVSDRDIQKEQKLLQAAQLKPIPGTMKLHQLSFQKDYEIAYRNISCTCQEPSDCSFCTGQEIKFSRILADKKQQEVKTKLKPLSLESPYAIDLTEEKGPSKPKKAKTEEHTNTELPFDKNEAIYSLKNVKSHRELKSRCSQLIKDLGTLESNPLMVNIMDQRMEVDAKSNG
ncbi:unnamed protein product [Mytilus coruscus]|uniref:Uncharacterized protein n=1 Tax=Mytilus coruscus TaxID=42192 RepID=A0A6J8DY43_MYTCO|nr:unnamed protein product [Mytilus coruscus]